MPDAPPNMLEHAIKYAARGWMLFPVHTIRSGICSCKDPACTRAGKHPMGHLVPQGLKNASCQENIITDWWTREPDANIGLATGTDSGLVVVDADGQAGLLTLQGLDVPDTIRARSGRIDGGEHVYFNHPGEFIKSTRILGQNSGVDTRGDGGYIILPPSLHHSGNRYQWIVAPGERRFAKCPKWLLEAAGDKKRSKDDDGDDASDEPEKITEGRNIWLTQKAGHLRRHGLDHDVLLAALRNINDNLCDPPLPDEELQHISENAMKWQPAADPHPRLLFNDPGTGEITELPDILATAKLTDMGNAECFEALRGDRFRWVHDANKWYQWVGTHWQEDDTGAALRAMVEVIRARGAAKDKLQTKADKAHLMRHCDKSESAGNLRAALSLAGSMMGMTLSVTNFDTNLFMLGTPSGVVDLQTGEAKDPDQSLLISRLTDAYYDPEAKAPLWDKTVHDIFNNDEEMVRYVQRAVGYCLTGDMREQAFFICYGKGANGKSTFLGVLRKILGDYAGTISFESFDSDKQSRVGDDLAGLRGKRLIVCIEAEHSRRLAEARVKQVTGGDELRVRFLYGQYFSYDPQFKLWLAVNHRPLIRGDDHGIWRRVHLIPFERRFEGSNDNKDLKLQLIQEAPGILNWMIEGMRMWQRDGLTRPSKVAEATESYRADSDQVGRWIEEMTVVDPKGEILMSKAFQQYRDWCGMNNERPHTQIVFQQRLQDRGFQVEKSRNNSFVIGLRSAVLSGDTTTVSRMIDEDPDFSDEAA